MGPTEDLWRLKGGLDPGSLIWLRQAPAAFKAFLEDPTSFIPVPLEAPAPTHSISKTHLWEVPEVFGNAF